MLVASTLVSLSRLGVSLVLSDSLGGQGHVTSEQFAFVG